MYLALKPISRDFPGDGRRTLRDQFQQTHEGRATVPEEMVFEGEANLLKAMDFFSKGFAVK